MNSFRRTFFGVLITILGLLLMANLLGLRTPYFSKNERFFIVCDAGSTGTRLFLYKVTNENRVINLYSKDKEPSLSSLSNISDVKPYFTDLMRDVRAHLTHSQKKQVKVSILGTGGMRMLSDLQQSQIWDSVKSVLGSLGFPADATHLDARTITGEEEGLLGLIGANFITKQLVPQDIKAILPKRPVGVLDLGGASTQISYTDFFFKQRSVVASYPLGVSALSKKLTLLLNSPEGLSASSCFFRNQDLENSDIRGTGDAEACRSHLKSLLEVENLPEVNRIRKLVSQAHDIFYALSGYMYVTDFFIWADEHILNQTSEFQKGYPQPVLNSFFQVVQRLCRTEWHSVLAVGLSHKYTRNEYQLRDRCLGGVLISVLLEDIYGFPSNSSRIIFDNLVDGEAIDWTTGALVSMAFGEPLQNFW